MSALMEIAERLIMGVDTEREKAIVLHNYVRDEVKFGFNKNFDASTPEYTLSCQVGHCNSKSRLMVALFREIGLEAYQHFVVIPRGILEGVSPALMWWLFPAEINHAYVEVKINGRWCKVDSFCVDSPLLEAASAKLKKEGRSMGYGVRVGSTNHWSGESDAFSQFEPAMMIEDHGRIDDLEAYFRSSLYHHKLLGVHFNTTFKLMNGVMVKPINRHIDRIRAEGGG